MNRSKLLISLVLALLFFAFINLWVAGAQGSIPNLTVTDVTIKPESPYPGQETVVTLKYENLADAEIVAQTIRYTITVRTTNDMIGSVVGSPVTKTNEVKNLKKKGETGELTATFYAPQKQDTYYLHVTFNDKTTIKPFAVETALPPELARLFAGLGVFAAVMAIMAVGTEVALEPLKSILGLKQKVTAMEALEQLKKELPGQLAGLGVDAKQVEQVQELFKSVETTLKPVDNINAALAKFREGRFHDAITETEKLKLVSGDDAEKKLTEWKTAVISKIEEGLGALRVILPLNDATVNQIKDPIVGQINGITIKNLQDVAATSATLCQEMVRVTQQALANPTLAKDWLGTQVDALLAGGKDNVEKLLDANVITTLQGLGFSKEQTDPLKNEIMGKLNSADQYAKHQMNTYTESVRQLLFAVEERRQKMQSPFRKIWRAIRDNVPYLGDGLRGLETLVNKLRMDDQPSDKFGEIHRTVEARIRAMVPTSVANVLLWQEDQHQDEETSRVRWLRTFSIIVGTWLAYWLKVDAAKYLNYAIPGIEQQINTPVFAELSKQWNWIPSDLTVGIVLTGLAAAAGSKFWRDLLGRLQAARGQAEEAARLVRQVKGMIEPEK